MALKNPALLDHPVRKNPYSDRGPYFSVFGPALSEIFFV